MRMLVKQKIHSHFTRKSGEAGSGGGGGVKALQEAKEI